jgi:response regulator RpfG family c-di-GMP phosphodiesterase
MTLFQGTGANPSESARALGHVIALFGAAGDYALGNPPGHAARVASAAASMAQTGGVSAELCDAIYFAGVLHGIGALGNAGLRKADALRPRAAMMERWNIPATGARLCAQIPGLPAATADIVRWHAEAWDGTGYPDQLRWHGIPKAAQFVHIAETYCEAADPEDAMSAIVASSGRTFSPEEVRTFLMWFHTYGGEIDAREMPAGVLVAPPDAVAKTLTLLSEAIDAHTATRGRAMRVAQRSAATASVLKLPPADAELLDAAAHLFGLGEMNSEQIEWHQFDPLSALGRETRGRNAVSAASVLEPLGAFAALVPILRARAEWFDGTGRPGKLRADAIPVQARILAVCIAHDALDEQHRTNIRDDRSNPLERLEHAAGTQFDPAIVRAFAEGLKARA